MGQDGDDDFVAGFGIIVEERKTTGVGLNEEFGGIVESAAGMVPE